MLSKLDCNFYKFYVSEIVNEILVMLKNEVLLMFITKGLAIIQAT